MAELHDTTEHYLLTILQCEEEGERALRARLAERLAISAPSVTQQVERLIARGLVREAPDRILELTAEGRRIATAMARRHRLAERLLVDVIGIDWEDVHEEADRWEHAISERVERRLVELLGDPATCPHGNPIPGSRRRRETVATRPLSEVVPGRYRVARVSERLESDHGALRTIARAAVVPGAELVVTGVGRAGGVSIRTEAGRRSFKPEVAGHVFVSPLS